MRKRRLIGNGASCYHVMSRVTERRFYLGEREKEMFRRMMRRVAAFSGVRVLTYCVLDNHFHMLIEVPERVEIDDGALFQRLRQLYRGKDWDWVLWEFEQCKGCAEREKAVRDKYLRRMYDLSEFMKTLKQRFAIWFNKTRDREGALWDARFKSVLVQGADGPGHDANEAIVTMAAYIDLNAVRAGIVSAPQHYRWCGYAEAFAGSRVAREGIGFLMGWREGCIRFWSSAFAGYQQFLRVDDDEDLSPDRIRQVLSQGGVLSRQQMLRCRVRYLTDGLVLGSRAFVDVAFETRREFFGAKRKSGARSMRGGQWGHLYVARDLQRDVVAFSG